MTTLWDFAGVDGLAVARDMFGSEAARLSVWQSLDESDWSCLRLCENNFRVRLPDGTGLEAAARGRRVWLRPCPMTALIARGDVEALSSSATAKPPHRLAGLPMGRAVPARLDGQAVLLWLHRQAGTPCLEVHMSARDADVVRASLSRAGIFDVPFVPTTANLTSIPPRAVAAADSPQFVRATGARGEIS